MDCRILHNIPGFYPLGTSSTPPSPPLVVTTKNVSKHCQAFVGGQKSPLFRKGPSTPRRAVPHLSVRLLTHLSAPVPSKYRFQSEMYGRHAASQLWRKPLLGVLETSISDAAFHICGQRFQSLPYLNMTP